MNECDFLIIGGGAAGFFAAINAAEFNPNLKIIIVEKNREVLQKVKVSGGGRCNVTNSCFDSDQLSLNYPRGNEFLKEPFKRFGSKNAFEWFEKKGVPLKIEKDGRVFPKSDSSQSIIDLFNSELKKRKIKLLTSERVEDFEQNSKGWLVKTNSGLNIQTQNLLIASGSDKRIWEKIDELKINIIEQAPSLFTFNIKDEKLQQLQGVSFIHSKVSIINPKFDQIGPLLITHWGVSGPVVLKLSAWAAIELQKLNYEFQIKINFIPNFLKEQVIKELRESIENQGKKNVMANPLFGLTSRFWKYICEKSNISEHQKWAETGKKHFQTLSDNLCEAKYDVKGKSTFKEEFVTAGGVDLEEIDPKTFSSKKYPNLFFAGEILNIDAITGGFNFQAAWTGAWHAAKSL